MTECLVVVVGAGAAGMSAALLSHPPEHFRADHGIDLRLHTRALAMDPERRTVTVADTAGTRDIGYSRLIITAGAAPALPPVPGLDGDRVFTVRTRSAASGHRRRSPPRRCTWRPTTPASSQGRSSPSTAA